MIVIYFFLYLCSESLVAFGKCDDGVVESDQVGQRDMCRGWQQCLAPFFYFYFFIKWTKVIPAGHVETDLGCFPLSTWQPLALFSSLQVSVLQTCFWGRRTSCFGCIYWCSLGGKLQNMRFFPSAEVTTQMEAVTFCVMWYTVLCWKSCVVLLLSLYLNVKCLVTDTCFLHLVSQYSAAPRVSVNLHQCDREILWGLSWQTEKAHSLNSFLSPCHYRLRSAYYLVSTVVTSVFFIVF